MAKALLLATTFLISLVMSGCSHRASQPGEAAEDQPGTSSGISFFGDARLGASFNRAH